MLRSMPPVIATSKSFATNPSAAALIAAIADAQAASTTIVGAVEVEYVRDASGNAVGQFARHGVFGNFGKRSLHPVMQFARDVASHRCRQGGEAGAFGQFAGVFGKVARATIVK